VDKALPYFAEHNIMPTPDRIHLDPRCKMGLVFSTTLGNGEQSPAHCEKCGNGEDGIPYIRAVLLRDRLHAVIFRCKADRATVLQILRDLKVP
jgi:hypothetical protein